MSEFLDLHGKVAVVTGAASGLGQAVARGLVREGARVVLGDIDKAGLERTAGELGGAARWHRTDVARRDDVAALFRVCDEAFGPVEILASDRAASFMFGPNLNIDSGSQMGTS